MPTFRLVVAYDGSGFRGFARQPGLPTVQGTIESALQKILGEQVATSGAGRTDAGVHALGQVVSFRSEEEQDPRAMQHSLNALCGPSIAVLDAGEAPEGFDARFSAETRSYEYGILNRPIHDPFSRHTTWHHPQPLDAKLMGKAAEALVGEHAFDSFGRVEEGKTPIRRVESLEIERDGDLVAIRITANSFLQQMVRSIVGTLAKVGVGQIPPEEMHRILHARDRSLAGPVAPAHGLFLVSVAYPQELIQA